MGEARRLECLQCGAHITSPAVASGEGWYRVYCEVCGAERDAVQIASRHGRAGIAKPQPPDGQS